MASREPGVEEVHLVPRVENSALSLALLRLEPGAATQIQAQAAEIVLFVSDGDGTVSIGQESIAVGPRSAVTLAVGEVALLTAGAGRLNAAHLAVDAGADVHVPMGTRGRVAVLDLDGAQAATGGRSFQILADPYTGFYRGTVFVGVVPSGASPWHFHQYDEIIWVLSGHAVYHQANLVQPMRVGDAVRIPPRVVHINENPAKEDLLVLGLFTPAGSPSAAYLPPRRPG